MRCKVPSRWFNSSKNDSNASSPSLTLGWTISPKPIYCTSLDAEWWPASAQFPKAASTEKELAVLGRLRCLWSRGPRPQQELDPTRSCLVYQYSREPVGRSFWNQSDSLKWASQKAKLDWTAWKRQEIVVGDFIVFLLFLLLSPASRW